MQQIIFIADLIACSTCFGHHYAHHQELESIIQMADACGIWCFGFQVATYRQLENQSTKYHRQQPSVYYSGAPDDVHNGAQNMLSKQ